MSIRASACALHIEHDIPTGFLLLLIVQYKRSLSLPRSVCCNGYSRYLHRPQTTEIRLPSFAVLQQPLNNIIIIEREKNKHLNHIVVGMIAISLISGVSIILFSSGSVSIIQRTKRT